MAKEKQLSFLVVVVDRTRKKSMVLQLVVDASESRVGLIVNRNKGGKP